MNTSDAHACLSDLLRSDTSGVRRSSIAEFTGVQVPAVNRWWRKKHMPIGEILIKLRYYLEANGYTVREVVDLPSVVQCAGRLLAFRVVDLDVIVRELGYELTDDSRTNTLGLLRGKRVVAKDRLDKLAVFVSGKLSELEEKRTKYVVLRGAATHRQQSAVVAGLTASPRYRTLEVPHALVIASLPQLAVVMLPLAEEAASNRFSADDRTEIRNRAGFDTIFRLSTALNALCGERARHQLGSSSKQQGKKKS